MAHSTQKKRGRDPILRRIDHIRRTVALWTLARGYLWVVLLVAVLVFGGVLADHAFVLQKWGRLAFFRAFLLSLSAAALAATLFPLLRRVSRLYVARRMEEQRPELRNSLISYIQCREDPNVPGEVKGLMARRAAGHMRSLDAAVAVDYSTYVRLGAALGIVLVAFVLYWAFSPKSATLSLERLFHPGADIRPPTATQLYDVKPGELYVLKGARPAISASVSGVRPRGVYVVWDGASFTGRRILLSEKDGDGWQGTFPPVLEDGGYYLAAGDTRTDRYGIHVVPRPAVQSIRLQITPPAYTGMAPFTVENADAAAPVGSHVHVVATTSIAPAGGYLDFGDGRRSYLDPVPGGQTLAGDLVLLESGTYGLHVQSTAYPDGSTFSNDEPVTYKLTCLPDKAPTATLTAPPDGTHADNTDTVQVTYSAADDYGLARVRLAYSVTGITMQSLDVAQPGVREVKDGRYAWDLSSTAAQPGQTVTYRIQVEDNRPGHPQTGQSEARRIIINPRDGTAPRAKPPTPQPPATGERQPPEQPQTPPKEGRPAEQPQQPTPEQPAAAPKTPPEQQPSDEGKDKSAIDKYRDYVRSIYKAMGVEPPGDEGQPGQQTAEANQPGQTGQGQEGQPQQPAAPGQSQQGARGAGRQGQQAAQGGPAQPGGQESGNQPAQQGAEDQGAEGAAGQGGAEQAANQGTQGAEGAGEESGSQGAQSAEGQSSSQGASGQTGEQGTGTEGAAQGTSGQGGSQGAGGQGAQEAGAQGSESGSGSQGQGGAQSAGGGQSSGASQSGTGSESSGGGSSAADGASSAGGSSSSSSSSSASSGTPAGGGQSSTSGGASGATGSGIKSLPPIPTPTPKTLPELKKLDAAVDHLEHLLDEDRVPERVYHDLGLNREALRQFIEEYRRRRAEAGAQSPQPPEKVNEEAGRLLQGAARAASGVQVQDARPEKPTQDTLHSRFEGADRLSSRYRDLVNQYYKALSEEQ